MCEASPRSSRLFLFWPLASETSSVQAMVQCERTLATDSLGRASMRVAETTTKSPIARPPPPLRLARIWARPVDKAVAIGRSVVRNCRRKWALIRRRLLLAARSLARAPVLGSHVGLAWLGQTSSGPPKAASSPTAEQDAPNSANIRAVSANFRSTSERHPLQASGRPSATAWSPSDRYEHARRRPRDPDCLGISQCVFVDGLEPQATALVEIRASRADDHAEIRATPLPTS